MRTIIYYSLKGGVGTSVTAAVTAMYAAKAGDRTILCGREDVFAVVGVAKPETGVAVDVKPGLTVCVGNPEGLANDADTVIYDAGTSSFGNILVDNPDATTIMVVRNCYLALRAAVQATTPDEYVCIMEPERSLDRASVEDVLSFAPVTFVEHSTSVARKVDAGLLVAY